MTSAVVLLRATPGPPNELHRLIPVLERDFEVFVPGLPGSDPDQVEAYAQHILAELHDSGAQHPVVAGCDLGSQIAEAMARAEPSYVWGLVITPVTGADRPKLPPDQRVSVPVTVLWPERDPAFTAQSPGALGDWFRHYEVIMVPACGHAVPLDAPEVMAAAIRERARL